MSSTRYDSKVVEYPTEAISAQRQDYKSDGNVVVDLRSVFNAICRGRWVILSVTLLFACLSGLLLGRAEPVYRASAKVMFGIEKANITDLEQLLSDSPFDQRTLENQIQVLSSSKLIKRVVTDLKLQDDPDFNVNFKGYQPTPEAEPSFIARFFGTGGDPELEAEEFERRKLLAAVKTLTNNLSLNPVGESSVIEIAYVSYSPTVSADIVNAVAEQYIIDQLQVKLETANAATGWLSARVEELRTSVQDSEEAIQELRTRLSDDAGQGLEITQQQLAALNAALSTARGQAANAEARYKRFSEALAAGQDLSSESDAIREYRDEEGDLLNRRNTLSANHPAIPQIDAQIATLRERIQEEAGRVVTAAEGNFETARAQVQELEMAVRDLESKALAQSREEIRIRELEREAEAKRLLYESLLVRLNETAQQEDLQSADARILSPAEIPIDPESRSIPQIVIVAGTLGAFIAIGFVLMRDNFNNTFRSPSQIEELTGEPVLATLPALGSGARARNRDLISHLLNKPGSSLAEAVRNLRTSILLPNTEHPPKVVAFTSSVPDEGKSTTSMLTAITSRQMDKSTIIVDCDLRLSSFEQLLDTREDKPGILSVLNGTATPEDALHEDPATGLHVLMVRRGERPVKSERNAADILSSQRFSELVRYLSQNYDVVILDTPPALIVTDARIVSSLADMVIYVVRWNRTPRDAVLAGLKELRSVKAPIGGMVLSMVNERSASRSVFDGYTHHRGKYGAYYTT